MDERNRKYHPTASLFPLMQDAEFAELKADVAANGLLEPVWLHPDGSIVDGRNRHRACIELGIRPQFRTWSGEGSLVSFVVSMNLHRRHLTSSQRAVIALDVLPMLEEEAKERQAQQALINQPQSQNTEIIPHSEKGTARDAAAALFQTNPRYVSDAKKLAADAPELLDEVRAGEKSIPEAKREARRLERDEIQQGIIERARCVPPSDRWHIWQANIETWQAPRQYDFIITDPPYPKEYLYLYEILAMRAAEWLTPSGLLIAMCGQSYINEIYTMMDRHLTYYWTACYLTPGQPTPLRQRQVNASWKPLLIYSTGQYAGKTFGDVFKSEAGDKAFHAWGQSVSGMTSIVRQFCLKGQAILDPFCGAGATGIAALGHGCLFDGIDINQESVDITTGRLHDKETIR